MKTVEIGVSDSPELVAACVYGRMTYEDVAETARTGRLSPLTASAFLRECDERLGYNGRGCGRRHLLEAKAALLEYCRAAAG